MEKRYGCKTCGKEVIPQDGKLICCGITEDVPIENCRRCGYPTHGVSFEGYRCMCFQLDMDEGLLDQDDI